MRSISSQQLQGQGPTFTNLDVQNLKNWTLAGHDLSIQKCKREIWDQTISKGRQILTEAASFLQSDRRINIHPISGTAHNTEFEGI